MENTCTIEFDAPIADGPVETHIEPFLPTGKEVKYSILLYSRISPQQRVLLLTAYRSHEI